MPIVQLPDGKKVAFPDGMTELEMSDAIVSNFPELAPREVSDTSQGWKRGWAQLPELTYGAGAMLANTAEEAFGEGGLSTSAKNYLLKKYQEKTQENQQYAPSTSFTDAFEATGHGDYGKMGDWAQDALGYTMAQLTQTVATGGIGALGGKLALKSATEKMLAGNIAKSADKIAAEMVAQKGLTGEAAALAAESVMPEAIKIAGSRAAQGLGAGLALTAQNFGMEAGDIYGKILEEHGKTGEEITGDDLVRGLGAAGLAAFTETATDLLGLGAATGRIKIGSKSIQEIPGMKGRAARGLIGASAGVPVEAGQEWVQTGLEQWGAKQDLGTPEAQQERVEGAAMGAFGGAVAGGGIGLISKARQPAPELPQEVPPEEKAPPVVQATPADILNAPTVDSQGAPTIDNVLAAFNASAPTNFGQLDEFANFLQQEKTDIAAQRGLIAQRQSAMRESSLESADARVAGQRVADTRAGRLAILDEVYASGDRTPGMTFLQRLEAEYPNQPLPTPEEKALIASRESAYQGFTKPDIEPSLPNEMVMPEPSKPGQGQKFDRTKLIRKLLTVKGNRVKGDAIVNKDGKPILKSVTQDELTGAQQYGQAPQVPAAGLDTGIAPVAERAEPAGILVPDGLIGSSSQPVVVAGQDRAVPLPGVGNEALVAPAAPEVADKADEIMRLVNDIGVTAITRDQVIGLIKEKGMGAAEKTVLSMKASLEQRAKAAAVGEKITTALNLPAKQPQGERNALQKQDAVAAAVAAANHWDTTNRNSRGDAWFEGAKVNEDARRGFTEALNNGGSNLQAHGMAKEGTLTGSIRNLTNLLQNGLDLARNNGRLDTAPMVSKPGEGLVGATASGSAYSEGAFMLVARPGESISGNLSGVGAILVNQAHADIISEIAAAIHSVRPDITVSLYSDAGKVAKSLNSAKQANQSEQSTKESANALQKQEAQAAEAVIEPAPIPEVATAPSITNHADGKSLVATGIDQPRLSAAIEKINKRIHDDATKKAGEPVVKSRVVQLDVSVGNNGVAIISASKNNSQVAVPPVRAMMLRAALKIAREKTAPKAEMPVEERALRQTAAGLGIKNAKFVKADLLPAIIEKREAEISKLKAEISKQTDIAEDNIFPRQVRDTARKNAATAQAKLDALTAPAVTERVGEIDLIAESSHKDAPVGDISNQPQKPAQEAESKIGGYPVSGLGDKELKAYLHSSKESDRVAAQVEIDRRAAAVATAKEPWQMTREEFFSNESNVRNELIANGLGAIELQGWRTTYVYENPHPAGPFKGVTVSRSKQEAGTTVGMPFGRAIVKSSTKTKNTEPLLDRGELFELGKALHRRVVADAIDSGNDVPAEVLADYPDLAPKPATPLSEIKVISWAINLKDSKGTPVFEIPPLRNRVEFRVPANEAVAELDADISKLEKMRVCLNG